MSHRQMANLAALRSLLGARAPEDQQALDVASPAAGGGGISRPINWNSPDSTLHLYADATDAASEARVSTDCGAEVRIRVNASGAPEVRVLACLVSGFRRGYELTPDGLRAIKVADDVAQTTTTDPAGPGIITVQACVDGTTKTLKLFGTIVP